MKLRIAVLTVVALGCFVAFHLSDLSSRGTAEATATTDPCAGTGLKSSAAITATSGADIVAPVSGETVYVCGFVLTSSGGTSELFGSDAKEGLDCGAGSTPLTGEMALSDAPLVVVGNNRQTLFATLSGNALCVSGGGTGFVTYIQK